MAMSAQMQAALARFVDAVADVAALRMAEALGRVHGGKGVGAAGETHHPSRAVDTAEIAHAIADAVAERISQQLAAVQIRLSA